MNIYVQNALHRVKPNLHICNAQPYIRNLKSRAVTTISCGQPTALWTAYGLFNEPSTWHTGPAWPQCFLQITKRGKTPVICYLHETAFIICEIENQPNISVCLVFWGFVFICGSAEIHDNLSIKKHFAKIFDLGDGEFNLQNNDLLYLLILLGCGVSLCRADWAKNNLGGGNCPICQRHLHSRSIGQGRDRPSYDWSGRRLILFPHFPEHEDVHQTD